MNYEDQIEDYIFDRLLPEEKIAFEIAMKENESLANAVQDNKLAKSISKSLIEIEVREKLNEFKLKKSKINMTYLFTLKRIAAIFIIVFGVVWLYKIFFPSFPTSDEIYTNLYEKPNSILIRSANDSINSLDSAIYYFEEYRWEDAKILFTRLLTIDSLNLESTYYLGHISMIEKDFKTARILFDYVISFGPSKFFNPSLYQILLINLVEKKNNLAKPIYIKLQETNLIGNDKSNYIKKIIR